MPKIFVAAAEVDGHTNRDVLSLCYCGGGDREEEEEELSLSSITSSAIGSPASWCGEGEKLPLLRGAEEKEAATLAKQQLYLQNGHTRASDEESPHDGWFLLDETEDDETSECNDTAYTEMLDSICTSAPTPEERAELVIKHLVGPPPLVSPPPSVSRITPTPSSAFHHLPWMNPMLKASPYSTSMLREVPTVPARATYSTFSYAPDPDNHGKLKRVKAGALVSASIVRQRDAELRRIRRGNETRVKKRRGKTARSLLEIDLPHLKCHIAKRRIYQCLMCKAYSGDLPRAHIGCKNHRVWAASLMTKESLPQVALRPPPSLLLQQQRPSPHTTAKPKKLVWSTVRFNGAVK